MKVILELTVEQAQVVSDALDLHVRVRLGQLTEISQLVRYGAIPADQQIIDYDSFEKKMVEAKILLGHSASGSFGIGHPKVPISTHRAYETMKVLDKCLAFHRDQNPSFRGVNYDGLIVRYTLDSAPVARIEK